MLLYVHSICSTYDVFTCIYLQLSHSWGYMGPYSGINFCRRKNSKKGNTMTRVMKLHLNIGDETSASSCDTTDAAPSFGRFHGHWYNRNFAPTNVGNRQRWRTRLKANAERSKKKSTLQDGDSQLCLLVCNPYRNWTICVSYTTLIIYNSKPFNSKPT